MRSLEENRAFVLSELQRKPRTTDSHRRLLSIIAGFQHDVVSENSYEILRTRISDATPRSWKDPIEGIAIIGYRSSLPSAEALSDGDHAGVVVFDGLVALLALLNEALMKSHSAYTNALLTRPHSALAGVNTGPEQMSRVPRGHKWIEDLLCLLMYWASDLTTEELLPSRDKNDIPASAQMLTQFQQIFVVCHELGHFLHDWIKKHAATRAMTESALEETISAARADPEMGLMLRNVRQSITRIADESVADHYGFLLYRQLIDKGRFTEVQKGLAQAAPYLFYYYVGIVDRLRGLRESFQFDRLESMAHVALRASMSSATHADGDQRRQAYIEASNDWLGADAQTIMSSYGVVMNNVAAATTGEGPELSAWGTFLGRSGERG